MGSEGAGIPSEILSCVPETIFVPPCIRPGHHDIVVDTTVDSLNVSVAAGIIINKLCQQLRNT